MSLESTDATTPALLSLVGDDELHARRLADDRALRFHSAPHDVGDEPAHADAADFLVVGQREMQGALEPPAQKFGDECETGRRKAFHVGDAAAVDLVADPGRL